jgi:hypothetical protein
MVDYIEERQELDVPSATGIEGYLSVVRSILNLPRVQEITIKVGKVRWHRFKKPDEPDRNLEVDLDTLMPYGVIRNHEVQELMTVPDAAACLGAVLAQAHIDGLNPIAWVSGPGTLLHGWYKDTTGLLLPKDSVFGLDLLLDSNIGQEALILCTGFGKRAALVDTVRSYKITMPWRQVKP